MKTVSELFIENEEVLENYFDFERIGKQLMFISAFPEELPKRPTEAQSRKARLIRDKIHLNGWSGPKLENTIFYVQARELINQYRSSF